MLVHTEYGKILAGYSHYRWDEVSDGNYVNDAKRKAFLLQLDKREKLVAQRDNRLIKCQSDSGPAFGWNDLVLGDRCNVEKSFISDFPGTFNKDCNSYMHDEQESRTAFSGVPLGIKMRVKEY